MNSIKHEISYDGGWTYVGTASYGEHTHASLTISEVKKMIAWLDRWLAFKDANCTKDEVKG